jgi:hypothetical protein
MLKNLKKLIFGVELLVLCLNRLIYCWLVVELARQTGDFYGPTKRFCLLVFFLFYCFEASSFQIG